MNGIKEISNGKFSTAVTVAETVNNVNCSFFFHYAAM